MKEPKSCWRFVSKIVLDRRAIWGEVLLCQHLSSYLVLPPSPTPSAYWPGFLLVPGCFCVHQSPSPVSGDPRLLTQAIPTASQSPGQGSPPAHSSRASLFSWDSLKSVVPVSLLSFLCPQFPCLQPLRGGVIRADILPLSCEIQASDCIGAGQYEPFFPPWGHWKSCHPPRQVWPYWLLCTQLCLP